MDAAWAIVRAKGGTVVYFPAMLSDDHWLVGLVGLEKATALCLHFRDSTVEMGHIGRRLVIPKASIAQGDAAWEKVMAGNLSLTEIAQLMDVTTRTVSYRRAGRAKRVDERQKKLPF